MRTYKYLLSGLFAAAVGLSAASAGATGGAGAVDAVPAKAGTVVTLPGLRYEIVKSGPVEGSHPKLSDDVTVHYEGRLADGTVFDSTFAKGAPATMPLRPLIPGWGIALRLMRPGDEWIITLPPEMAYGETGIGPIPANSTLIFRIQLISHKPTPKPAPAPAN